MFGRERHDELIQRPDKCDRFLLVHFLGVCNPQEVAQHEAEGAGLRLTLRADDGVLPAHVASILRAGPIASLRPELQRPGHEPGWLRDHPVGGFGPFTDHASSVPWIDYLFDLEA